MGQDDPEEHGARRNSSSAAETEFLTRLRRGDPEAGHRLVQEQYPGVYRYLLYLSGHRETAEDLAQETFLQAWRHLDQFQGRSSLQFWLHRIARREFLRARGRQRAAVSLEEVAEAAALDGAGWTDEVELRLLLSQLPEEQREVVFLHSLAGYSSTEIARILQAPASTIRARLRAARMHLQRELGEGDLSYLNEPAVPMRPWGWLPLDQMYALETRLALGGVGRWALGVGGSAFGSNAQRLTPNARSEATEEETMERREFLRQAAVGAAGLMLTEPEKEVVDSRLTQKVTCAFKGTALSDLCEKLKSDTGVQVTAGPSVADEKVTLFCEKLPLREVMRQLSRPFGYTWLRSGSVLGVRSSVFGQDTADPNTQHRTPNTDYRYELVQDLRSQLLEEELRNRDRNAALIALEREIERYRPYLELSPDEALERSKAPPPAEKKLLEKLAGYGWGPIQMYYQLSRSELEALRAGQTLKYASEPLYGEQTLPPQVARGVLQSQRGRRLRLDKVNIVGREEMYFTTDADDPRGVPLTAATGVVATVSLTLRQSELGQFTLEGVSGLYANGSPGRRPADTHAWGDANPLAVGQSPAALQPNNAAVNAKLAGDPALRPRVSVQPEAATRLAGTQPTTIAHPEPDGPAITGDDRQTIERKVTSGDVLEALHRATGLPIVGDFYTRLYKPEAVSIRNQPLFDALNELADAMRARWNKEGDWLQFRSSSFYNDRTKEVPNRLLARWAASRQKNGAMTLEDLVEVARLTDAQLDGAEMAEGARELWALVEWELARSESLRPHLRFLAGFTPEQRQEAMSPSGLAFTRMPLAQQQGFIARALIPEDRPLQSVEEMEGAVLRVDYTQPGWFEWRLPGAAGNFQWVLPAKPGRRAPAAPVRERTRAAALQAAQRLFPQIQEMLLRVERRLHPQCDVSELVPRESQIVPTRLNLTVLYVPGAAHSRLITWTDAYTRNWTATLE